jgi:hypothetical protein
MLPTSSSIYYSYLAFKYSERYGSREKTTIENSVVTHGVSRVVMPWSESHTSLLRTVLISFTKRILSRILPKVVLCLLFHQGMLSLKCTFARAHLGMRPIHLMVTVKRSLFSSSLQAIHSCTRISLGVDIIDGIFLLQLQSTSSVHTVRIQKKIKKYCTVQ